MDRFPRVDVKTGKMLWETRLGTSVQGFPLTFSVGGKQYVAVSTGLGGGSPRMVPTVLRPKSTIRQRKRAVRLRAARKKRQNHSRRVTIRHRRRR